MKDFTEICALASNDSLVIMREREWEIIDTTKDCPENKIKIDAAFRRFLWVAKEEEKRAESVKQFIDSFAQEKISLILFSTLLF